MYLGEKKIRDSSGGIQFFILFALYYLGIVLGATLIHFFLGEEGLSTVYNT